MMTLDTLSENPWEDKDFLITATRLDEACSPVDERDHCEGDIKDRVVEEVGGVVEWRALGDTGTTVDPTTLAQPATP